MIDKRAAGDDAHSMRRVGVLAVTVLACMSAHAAASAGVQTSSKDTTQADRVIKVHAVNITGKRVRKPPAGIAGDVAVGRDRLLNAVPQFGKPKRAVVGQARYRTVFASAAVASVDVTATLPGGTIRARGKADFRLARNVIRVVDGTGAFAGAKGTVEERALPNDQTLNIYRLQAG